MSLCYDGEKWLMITLASVAISLTVGLVSLAYGQEWNTTQQTQSNQSSGVLMKYKGNYYCYDSATTEKKEVINAIKNDEVSSVQEMVNKFLTSMVEDKDLGLTVATGGCQSMVSQGSITNEDYHDEGIALEGTLTLEIEK